MRSYSNVAITRSLALCSLCSRCSRCSLAHSLPFPKIHHSHKPHDWCSRVGAQAFRRCRRGLLCALPIAFTSASTLASLLSVGFGSSPIPGWYWVPSSPSRVDPPLDSTVSSPDAAAAPPLAMRRLLRRVRVRPTLPLTPAAPPLLRFCSPGRCVHKCRKLPKGIKLV